MAEETTATKNLNGFEIFCRQWRQPTAKDPKCLVFISHGFGEHCGRYNELAELLAMENMLIFSHDHVGFGRSSGHRAWVDNFDNDYVRPLKMHVEEMANQYPNKKIFLYGHSLGGLMSCRLLQLHPSLANGLVMEAPFLGLPGFVPNWLVKTVSFLGRHVGGLPLGKAQYRAASRDPKVVEDFNNDPLVHHGVTPAKLAKEMLETQAEVNKMAKSLSVPILVCHGEADKLCPASISEAFCNESGSADKTFKAFPGGYHQLRGDLDEVKVPFLNLVVEWLNARC